jgi:hypothetical protein
LFFLPSTMSKHTESTTTGVECRVRPCVLEKTFSASRFISFLSFSSSSSRVVCVARRKRDDDDDDDDDVINT